MDGFERLAAAMYNKLDFGDMLKADTQNQQSFCSFTPFSQIPEKDRQALLNASFSCTESVVLKRCMGALVGMAIGDYAGHPLEFVELGEAAYRHCQHAYRNPRNTFRLQPGQWTDDAAMGLCMADSLLATRGYDGSDIRVRFWNWWFKGYNNAFRNDPTRTKSVGLGGNISRSIYSIRRDGRLPPPIFDAGSERDDSGNGSLMRLAPIPIFFHRSLPEARKFAKLSSQTTHPGQTAATCCDFLSFAIFRAINNTARGLTAKRFLDSIVQEYVDEMTKGSGAPGGVHKNLLRVLKKKITKKKGAEEAERTDYHNLLRVLKSAEPDGKERCWNWKSSSLNIKETLAARGDYYNGYPVSGGYFGSYCADGLAVALHSFYHTESFDNAIEKCVNFCGDADTTAAICGQLAGAFYGIDGICMVCISNLNKWDDNEFALRAILLHHLGSKRCSLE